MSVFLDEPHDANALSETPSFISIDAANKALKWPDVIAKLRDVYVAPFEPAASPARTVARANGAWVRTLTAVPPNCRFMGAKIFGGGPKLQVNYVIVLIEQETGLIRGIVDGALVTAFRTAGTSALAIDRVMPRHPFRMALIGSGGEARSHLEAIASIRSLGSVKIFSPTAANRARLAGYCEQVLKIPASAAESAEAAVRGAELVVAAARSQGETPIVSGSWLDDAAMVVSIGSTMPEQREVDTSAIEACDLIICDALDEVVRETGDMIAAAAAGVSFEQRLVSLNEVINGSADARIRRARRPMFKSVGAGLQDVAVAELVYERAIENQTATKLPIGFYVKR